MPLPGPPLGGLTISHPKQGAWAGQVWVPWPSPEKATRYSKITNMQRHSYGIFTTALLTVTKEMT